MPKFKSLTNNQLKEVCRAYELPDTGTKNEMVMRLFNETDTDEIDNAALKDILAEKENAMQIQINELHKMMAELLSAQANKPQNEQNKNNNENNNEQQENNNEQQENNNEQQENNNERQGDNSYSQTEVESVRSTSPITVVDVAGNIAGTAVRGQYNVIPVTRSLREASSVLPDFDPLKGPLTSTQFVDKVESIARAYTWPDDLKLCAAQTKLRGHAKDWVDSQTIFSNWKTFVDAFLLDFPSEINAADVHIQMIETRQTRNETMVDYYYKILAMGRRGNLEDRSIIKHIINGLIDFNVRQTLKATYFQSCPEFLKTIISISQKGPRNNFAEGTKKETEAAQPGKFAPDRKPFRCYNCNEVGHMSKNCPKPQKRNRCTSCNKIHPAGVTSCTGNNITTRRVRVHDHLFRKTVKIADKKYVAFIDTGSQCNMVRRSTVRELGATLEPCALTIRGIGGGVQIAKECITVDVEMDGMIFTIMMYVVNDEVIEEDMMLGQGVFADNGIKAVVENGKVSFQVAKTKCTPEIGENGENVITEKQYNALDDLLECYQDLFAKGLENLGKTDLIQMKIELDTETPLAQPPYRIPYPKRTIIADIVKDLLDADIIQTSESEYASPITLVKKPDGSDRFCVDYRRLNKHVRKEVYPMPNIEERLQDAKQYQLFCSLDLNSGYYQIPVEETSRKFTAFITPDGLYEFKRMPFGLRNAPMTFLRLMAKFENLLPKGIIIHYMDDILIGAKSYDEMMRKLKLVFDALRETGLTLNSKKCSFLTDSVTFLGHKLTASGIEPGEVKTRAIANFTRPINPTEVRRFMGLCGFFRKFILSFAMIAEPLYQLLRKDEPFVWTDSQEAAFNELKRKLTEHPVLAAYDVEAKHQIHTDASSSGLTAVLMQETGDGWKPVAYFSRATTDAEKHYHSYELETLAVTEGLERFRYYVYGKPIVVVTDCQAVSSTWKKREMIPRIARWYLKCMDFTFEIEHRDGTRMCHVDALSRTPDEEPREAEQATMRIDRTEVSEEDWIYSMQLQDQKLQEIVERIRKNDKQAKREFIIEKGRLMKLLDGKKLYVVPKQLRYRLVTNTHEQGGHLSVTRTMENIQKLMWFPRMRNFIKSALKSCVDCAYNKQVGGKTEGEYHYTDVEPVPFKVIHIDHLGPFPKSSKRMEHIIVMVDSFTKYVYMRAVPTTATKHTVRAIEELSAWVGMPTTIISDRGTSFTSGEFKNFCHKYAIRHVMNAVRTPRANGQVERMNRTILSMLLPLTKTTKKWDENLRQIQWSINGATNSSTQKSPNELLFGFQPRDIVANKLVLVLHDLKEAANDPEVRLEEMEVVRAEAARQIKATREKAKKRYDNKHSSPTIYEEGSLILVTNEAASAGHSRKLEPKFKGPFIVTKVLGNDRYLVEDLPGAQRTQRHYKSVYASDAIKPWCSLPEDDVDMVDEDVDEEGWPIETNNSTEG